jgi:hypothetical protein
MPRRTSRTASSSTPICGEPQLTHDSTGDCQTLGGRSDSVSCGVNAPFLWVLVLARLCALQEWCVCFLYLSGSPIIKSHCPWRSDNQGIPSPFVRTAGCIPWCVVQSFHNRGRTSLVFLFSSYLLRGYGIWIHCDCTPPIILLRLPLFLWTWGIIFGVFQRPPVDSCSTASCSYGAGRDEQTSSYTTVLKQKPLKYSLE